MKLVTLATIGIVAAMAAAPMPAWAAFCANEGPMAPQTLNNEGQSVTDTEAQEALDRQRLRAAGVPATSVERWNGCMRAFVKQADGTGAMQLFDPVSLAPLR